MKIRGQKLKTSLSCLLSLLLVLSSFGFAFGQTYTVPVRAELVPEGYLDFAISAGTITATNSRANPTLLTYSGITLENNEAADPIRVSSIAYTAPTAEDSFALAADSTDFATATDKLFSLVVSDGSNNWDFGANGSEPFKPGTTVQAQGTKSFMLAGHVSRVTQDTSNIDLGSLVVTVEATLDYASQPYVLLESMESGKTFNVRFGSDLSGNIQYSFNGTDWTIFADTGQTESTVAQRVGKFYLRGSNLDKITDSDQYGPNMIAVFGDAPVKVSGNIMSLLDYNNLPSAGAEVTIGELAFCNLFAGCSELNTMRYSTALVDASDLIMPAAEIGEGAYYGMFRNCSNLKYPPALPVKKAGSFSCQEMFRKCSSLCSIPLLYITDFNNTQSAVSYMFYDTGLALSDTKGGAHTNKYRIPAEGTATSDGASYITNNMFNTGVTAPALNTDYYTNLMLVPAQ